MARGRRGWLTRIKSLGRALVELLRAELDALGHDLLRTVGELRTGVILLAIAAFFGFWTVGALGYALIEVLTLWLPGWGAALTVAGLLGAIALVLVLVGRARLKRLESPARTVAKRIESHSAWLQSELLPDPDQE